MRRNEILITVLLNILFVFSETASIWLNGSGFVVFHVKQELEDFDSNDNYIAFHLKTFHYHGIIFTLQSHRYYLMIEMMHGKLRVELDLGEGKGDKST